MPSQPASSVRPVASAKPTIHTVGEAMKSIFRMRDASAQVNATEPATQARPAALPSVVNSAISELRIWPRVPPSVRISAVS